MSTKQTDLDADFSRSAAIHAKLERLQQLGPRYDFGRLKSRLMPKASLPIVTNYFANREKGMCGAGINELCGFVQGITAAAPVKIPLSVRISCEKKGLTDPSP